MIYKTGALLFVIIVLQQIYKGDAMHTGFAGQSHFSKVFKKMVGTTPGEFR